MVLLRYFRSHLKPDIYGHGYGGFIRQALAETPHYLFSVPLVALALALLPLSLIKWKRMEGYKRRFMYTYTIARPGGVIERKSFYMNVTDKSNIIDPARKCYYDTD